MKKYLLVLVLSLLFANVQPSLSQTAIKKVDFNNIQLKNGDVNVDIYNIDMSDFPDSVKIYLTIKDRYGNHITHLAPPYNKKNIAIWKDVIETIEGKQHYIEKFLIEEFHEESAPEFITSFVLDYSGSMNGETFKTECAMDTVKQFIRIGKDEFDIIQFDHHFENPVKLSNDTSDLTKLLPYSKFGGATALYFSSLEGLKNIVKSKKAKVAILFTDGRDNASFPYSADELVLKARQTNTKIFVIGYGSTLIDILSKIAKQTGGKAYFPDSLSQLESIFSDIYKSLNVYYVITYKLIKPKINEHNVTVNLLFPGLSDVVNCNKDYFINPVPINESWCGHFALFQKGSDVVDQSFYPLIKRLADYLVNNRDKKISIYGHTDSFGDSFDQKDLSLRRAYNVKNILMDYGVDIDQILNIEGLGFEKPIHPDDKCCPWMQYENNRVEAVFEN
ncbi:MAG: OmpA family protein [bacterium]